MKTISAADANRQVSRIMREVVRGETYVVTSRGRPAIRMEPVKDDEVEKARRAAAWDDLLKHLKARPILNIPVTWTRNDIYDHDV